MNEELPEEVTVCMRCEDMPGAFFPQSKGECEGCGAAVWVTQGTQLSIEHGVYPDAIYCSRCATDA